MAINPVSTSASSLNTAPRKRIQDEIISSKKSAPPPSSKDDAVSVKLSDKAASPKRVSVQQELLRDGADRVSSDRSKVAQEKGSAPAASETKESASSTPAKERKSVQQEIIDSNKKPATIA